MIETIPIAQNDYNFCTSSKDSYCGNFNLKVSEMIKNSASIFDKKSKLIIKELQNLKSDYLSQLQGLSDFLNISKNTTKSHKTVVKPHENSLIKRHLEKDKKISTEETKSIPLSAATKASYLEHFKEISANNSNNTKKNKNKLNTLTGFNNDTNKKKSSETNNSIVSTNNNSINKKTNSPSPLTKIQESNLTSKVDKNHVKKKIHKGVYYSADRNTSNRLNLNLNEFSERQYKAEDQTIPQFISRMELKNENISEKLPEERKELNKSTRFEIEDKELSLDNVFSDRQNYSIIVNNSRNLNLDKKSKLKIFIIDSYLSNINFSWR
jgi:hypothetical protein